jgi:hypothetical protein
MMFATRDFDYPADAPAFTYESPVVNPAFFPDVTSVIAPLGLGETGSPGEHLAPDNRAANTAALAVGMTPALLLLLLVAVAAGVLIFFRRG